MANSRFPNMSYCMCENTVAALVQIIEHMDEDPENFLQDLSMTELIRSIVYTSFAKSFVGLLTLLLKLPMNLNLV